MIPIRPRARLAGPRWIATLGIFVVAACLSATRVAAEPTSAIVKLHPVPAARGGPIPIPPGLEPLAPAPRAGLAGRGGERGGLLRDYYLLQADTPAALARRVQWLRTRPGVARVSPNPRVRLHATRVDDPRGGSKLFPDDFEFARQTSLHNEGSDGGQADADIDAPEAWLLATASTNLVVAVIDTGIDFHHPDLQPNLWINPGEIPGNGIDDDGNGFIDDIHGHSFVGRAPDPFDDHGHGTHVAGIIAARGDDRRGVAGVCWEARLMAIKAFDADGDSRLSDVLQALDYAVANGATVINASWGVDEENPALSDVVAAVLARGVLIIAAAGNDRSDTPSHPASLPGVVAVAATDNRDQRAFFSNHGSWISLAAPGEGILSTLPRGTHGLLSGTSMAAPHVAGVAALVWSANPALNSRQVVDILLNTCDPIQTDKPLGRGRLNAFKALSVKTPPPRLELRTLPARVRGRIPLLGVVEGPLDQWRLEAASAPGFTNWLPLASGSSPVEEGLLGGLDTAELAEGAVRIRLAASSRNGPETSVESTTIVQNFLLSSPVSSDVLPFPNLGLRVAGVFYGSGLRVELSHASGLGSTQWTSQGVSSVAIPDLSTNELIFATIEPEALGNGGPLTLRARVLSPRGTHLLFAENFHLDPALRPGFPVRLATLEDRDPPIEDWRDARLADLDGDGRLEIVITHSPRPSLGEARVLAFHADGSPLWSHTNSAVDFQGDIPAIGDVDGDGRREIFYDFDHRIHALRHDGKPLEGAWPVATEGALFGKTVADVLDDSAGSELVAFANLAFPKDGAWWREVLVLGPRGQPLRRWVTPDCDYTNDVRRIHAAVGSFRADGPARIVVPWGCGALACLDPALPDSQPVWIAPVSGKILGTPLLADLDGDGEREVVVAAAASREGALDGGVHVFDARGRLKRGWPALEGKFLAGQPAVGDLNGDGSLDLAVVVEGEHALRVLEFDGFEMEGFNVSLGKVSSKTSPIFGDFEGLGGRVLLSTAGYPRLAATGKDPDYLGGLSAWDALGVRTPLVADDPRTLLPMEGATKANVFKTAPPVLADLDGDGRLELLATSVEERANSVLAGSSDFLKRRGAIYAWATGVAKGAGPAWPMFAHDSANTSCQEFASTPAPPPADGLRRDRVATHEDVPVRIDVLANDHPPGAWRVESFTQPAHGIVSSLTPSRLLHTPAKDYHGPDRFEYVAVNQAGERATGQVEIRVRPVNDPPVARLTEVTLNRNRSADVFYDAVDPEGAKLTFKIVKPPMNGELFAYPTIGTYHPHKGFSGVDFYYYTASDGELESGWGQVVLRVTATNNPPAVAAERLTVRAGHASMLSLRGSDPDGDPVVFRLRSPPSNGVATVEEGILRYRPNEGHLGPDRLTVVGFDGEAESPEATIDIVVTRGNGIPEAIPAEIGVLPGEPTPVILAGRDRENQPLELRVTRPPLYGRLEGEPPNLVYHPPDRFEGMDRFEFLADDGEDRSLAATIRLKIARPNKAPEIVPASFRTPTGEPLEFVLEVSDPDGDQATLHLLADGSRGATRRTPEGWRYIPHHDAVGADQLRFAAWDGRAWGVETTVDIEIEGETTTPGAGFVLRVELEQAAVGEPMLRLEALGVPVGSMVRLERSENLRTWQDFGPMPPDSDGRRVLFLPIPAEGGAVHFRALHPAP